MAPMAADALDDVDEADDASDDDDEADAVLPVPELVDEADELAIANDKLDVEEVADSLDATLEDAPDDGTFDEVEDELPVFPEPVPDACPRV